MNPVGNIFLIKSLHVHADTYTKSCTIFSVTVLLFCLMICTLIIFSMRLQRHILSISGSMGQCGVSTTRNMIHAQQRYQIYSIFMFTYSAAANSLQNKTKMWQRVYITIQIV